MVLLGYSFMMCLLKKINKKTVKMLLLGVVIIIIGVLLFVLVPRKSEPLPESESEPAPVIETTPAPTEDPPEETPAPTPDETPPPTPTPIPANPLTGVRINAAGETWTEEMSRNRPYAVALGNANIGYSLRGIADADIICEYINYSHGVTRIMAIYQEVGHVPAIRGIRSFRTWSYEIACGYDAIFVTWGGLAYKSYHESIIIRGNPIVSNYESYDASHYGMRMDEDIFPRSSTGIPSENTGGITGERLVSGLPESFRAQHVEGYSQGFNFVDDGTPEDGIDAERFTVSFARFSNKKTEFIYNPDEGVYNVRQFGRNFTDYRNSGVKLPFTNVLVVQMNMTPNYNGAGHVYIDTTADNRRAYYFSGGKGVEIYWSRSDVNAPFEYFNLDGSPLEMGVGKTYICVVDFRDNFEPIEIGDGS